jgi:hypothetical protein
MTPRSRAAFFLKNNWMKVIAILELTLTVIALVIAIYALIKPGARRLPTLRLDPARTKIVDSTLFPNSSLKLVGANNTPITGDVTAVDLYFSNAGEQSIKSENILQPITVSLNDPTGQILEYRILKMSRPDIVKLNLLPTPANPARELMLQFNILEQNDYARCQIIYAGNPSATFTVTGVVEGATKIITNDVSLEEPRWTRRIELIAKFLIVAIIIVLLGLVVWTLRRFYTVMEITNTQDVQLMKSLKTSRLLLYLLVCALIFFTMLIFIVLPSMSHRQDVIEALPPTIKP